MKKTVRYNKKGLKKRLSLILMIYLDGLNEKKRKKLSAYLDTKVEHVVDYYVRLAKKKESKGGLKPVAAGEAVISQLPGTEADIILKKTA